MNEENHYLDEDFQEVLNESFSGNKETFNSHLLECTECKSQFETYKLVGKFIKSEAIQFREMPLLVDQAWKQVQKARYSLLFDRIQFWALIAVCCLSIALSLGYLWLVGVSLILFTMVLAFIGLFLLIAYKETKLSTPNLI